MKMNAKSGASDSFEAFISSSISGLKDIHVINRHRKCFYKGSYHFKIVPSVVRSFAKHKHKKSEQQQRETKVFRKRTQKK
jgi:hypothetical protein